MREVRKLYSPVHGAVSSLCELNTGGERHCSFGSAKLAAGDLREEFPGTAVLSADSCCRSALPR